MSYSYSDTVSEPFPVATHIWRRGLILDSGLKMALKITFMTLNLTFCFTCGILTPSCLSHWTTGTVTKVIQTSTASAGIRLAHADIQ